MKRLIITFAAIFLALPLAADVATQHLVRLNESFRIAEVLGPRVWPGFTAQDSPVILIDGELEYLLNSQDGAEGFTATTQTFRGRTIFSRPRIFPPGLQASFPAIGRPAVVIGTPEGTKTEPAIWTIVVLPSCFTSTLCSREVEKVASLVISPANDGQWQLSYPFPYVPASGGQCM